MCEEYDDINIALIKRPTYVNKKHLTKYHVLLVNLKIHIIKQC